MPSALSGLYPSADAKYLQPLDLSGFRLPAPQRLADADRRRASASGRSTSMRGSGPERVRRGMSTPRRPKAETLWGQLLESERRPGARVGHDRRVGDEILGKPVERADGLRMLRLLSGRTHQVYTAVALRHAAGCAARVSVSDVDLPRSERGRVQRLLALRRARRQGGRLRRAGAGRGVHRAHRGELFGNHGTAAVSRPPSCCVRLAGRSTPPRFRPDARTTLRGVHG